MAKVTTAEDLGIDLTGGGAEALYRWFLASMLFGRPIRQEQAAETYRALEKAGLTSPKRFAEHDREGLRHILDQGGYGRFDYQMTDALHETMATIAESHGSVSELVKHAQSRADLEKKLDELKGVGPKTIEIFLREVPAEIVGSAH
ncbi:DNA methylase [Naasia lichenicola]|uniref:DNA methylase n=1 Tax=Naasia lichenicola TaxID=2565933 RepID=A0A4S4FTA8_9MICO|nr:DNA methylase [Naasia lichenicola]THG33172.1 DNA methylase [Naasia lichenicola]